MMSCEKGKEVKMFFSLLDIGWRWLVIEKDQITQFIPYLNVTKIPKSKLFSSILKCLKN